MAGIRKSPPPVVSCTRNPRRGHHPARPNRPAAATISPDAGEALPEPPAAVLPLMPLGLRAPPPPFSQTLAAALLVAPPAASDARRGAGSRWTPRPLDRDPAALRYRRAPPIARGRGRTRSAATSPPTVTDGAADPASADPAPTAPAADATTTAPTTPATASTADATTTAVVPAANTTTAAIPAAVTAPAQVRVRVQFSVKWVQFHEFAVV
ncbi:hypothetical protein BRADI_3g40035v3 [Brachypodium distachyon]|uniref:Uncharacterized protein n=1 Tax=Brachypodium distachyon TaxID=15368 RepID=A0A2K2D279_BRADI|nr:hypothetical protein BRADI_3g40035v3 [Brachypodium distachyon]